MKALFKSLLVLVFALVATFASAQVVVPTPVGLTITGWSQSDGFGSGHTIGGDGLGTVQTVSDGGWSLGAKSFLTSNSNPNCTVDCSQTMSTLSIEGSHISAARTVNQGFGTLANPVIAKSSTGSLFSASMMQQWTPTVAPVVVPATP